MTITWYGQSCFRIDTREAVLAVDPFSGEIGLAPPRFHADAVLITHQHADHANAAAIPGAGRRIVGPGEYEFRGVSVTGIPTCHDAHRGRDRGPNTVFRIEADGLILAHLGDFGEGQLGEETLEALGNVDVLMVPVGGTFTIDAETASRVVHQVEPAVAVPMHYGLPGLRVKLAPVEQFLAAYGATGAERLEKLAVRPRDVDARETRVVVLRAQGTAAR